MKFPFFLSLTYGLSEYKAYFDMVKITKPHAFLIHSITGCLDALVFAIIRSRFDTEAL